jgi:hypothetical protein
MTPVPKMPRPGTRRADVLAALRRGERLTSADAIRRGWGWRFAADVLALREHGWPIVTEMMRQEGGTSIARYRLPAENVQDAARAYAMASRG